MTKTQKKVLYYSLATFSLIVTVFFIFVRKNAIEKFYEFETSFYMKDEFLPKLLHYGLFIASVLFALAFFIPKLSRTAEFELRPPSSFVVFSSAFTGFVYFGYLLRGVLSLFNKADDPALLEIITIILALPATIHFLSKITADGRKSDKRAILGLAPVIWCLAYVFVLYFDRTILINNPHKILTQMTFVAVALFFLYECRFPLGRPKSGAYLSFALIAQLLSGVTSVPNILYFFKNGEPLKMTTETGAFTDFLSTFMTGSPLIQSIIYDFLTFGFFLYATARLFSIASTGKARIVSAHADNKSDSDDKAADAGENTSEESTQTDPEANTNIEETYTPEGEPNTDSLPDESAENTDE